MGTPVPRSERPRHPSADPKSDFREIPAIRRRFLVCLRAGVAILAGFVVPAAFAATPTEGTAVVNQATATFMDAANSSRTAESNTETLAVGGATPVMALSVEVSSSSVAPMGTLTYTVIVQNTGTADASGIPVTIDGALS